MLIQACQKLSTTSLNSFLQNVISISFYNNLPPTQGKKKNEYIKSVIISTTLPMMEDKERREGGPLLSSPRPNDHLHKKILLRFRNRTRGRKREGKGKKRKKE